MVDPDTSTSNGAAIPQESAHNGKPLARMNTRHSLLNSLKVVDALVRQLDSLISTSVGQEAAIAAIEYASHILHHVLASAPWIALQTRLSLLIRSKKPSNRPKPPSGSPVQSRLLALTALCAETRYTLRLFGLVPLWMWGSSTLRSPPSDPIIRALTLIQVFANVMYQVLENGGYLASRGVISKRLIDRYGGIDKWYLWSIRAWFGHIVFQFVKLWREWLLRREKVRQNGQNCVPGQDRSERIQLTEGMLEKEAATAIRLQDRAWKKSLVNNVFWSPLCLHWCFESGIGFPDQLTGLFSFLAGVWELKDSWAAAATAAVAS